MKTEIEKNIKITKEQIAQLFEIDKERTDHFQYVYKGSIVFILNGRTFMLEENSTRKNEYFLRCNFHYHYPSEFEAAYTIYKGLPELMEKLAEYFIEVGKKQKQVEIQNVLGLNREN